MRNNANSQSALDARIENHKTALHFIQGIPIKDYEKLETSTKDLIKLYDDKLKCLKCDYESMIEQLETISQMKNYEQREKALIALGLQKEF